MSEPATTATPDYISTVNIGQVVSASVAGGQILAVVVGLVEDYPQLPPGCWFGVVANGHDYWVRDRQVVDWQPRCGTCGQSRWWWMPEAVVLCATCRPPSPDWRNGFEELADLTRSIPPDDFRLPAILAAVQGCDQAWLAQDWGRFQRHALEVQLLVVSGMTPSPGGSTDGS